MEKLTDVLATKSDMGEYATFVWASFGVAAMVILAMVLTSLYSLRKAQHALKLLQPSSASASFRNES